eukprot:2794222-Rhodomonas_salina.2
MELTSTGNSWSGYRAPGKGYLGDQATGKLSPGARMIGPPGNLATSQFHLCDFSMAHTLSRLTSIPLAFTNDALDGTFWDTFDALDVHSATSARMPMQPVHCRSSLGIDRCHQLAHLVPHKLKCRDTWIPAIIFLCVLGTNRAQLTKDEATEELVSCIESVDHSNITWRVWNYLALQNQYLDFNTLLVMFLPMLEWQEQLKWEGHGYNCIVMGRTADVYRQIDTYHRDCNNTMTVSQANIDSVCQTLSHFADAVKQLSRRGTTRVRRRGGGRGAGEGLRECCVEEEEEERDCE